MRLALALVLLPALLAGRAATASNTVPAAAAGSGTGPVSGYAVSAINYSLAGATIDGVSFTLSPAGASTVRVRVSPAAPWSPCTVVADVATCPLSSPAAEADALEVVAAGA